MWPLLDWNRSLIERAALSNAMPMKRILVPELSEFKLGRTLISATRLLEGLILARKYRASQAKAYDV